MSREIEPFFLSLDLSLGNDDGEVAILLSLPISTGPGGNENICRVLQVLTVYLA